MTKPQAPAKKPQASVMRDRTWLVTMWGRKTAVIPLIEQRYHAREMRRRRPHKKPQTKKREAARKRLQ